MRSTGSRIAMVTVLSLSWTTPGSAEDAHKLVLVDKGVSLAPIVIFKDAPPYTRRAADELAEYIEKASGAKPNVIEGEPKPIPEHAIWVGYQPILKKLFPRVDLDFKHPEEILIAANANHLVIVGRDRWDPNRIVVEGRNSPINGKQQEYGTVNAVYTFLQDCLGVRWLWPGEIGEDVLKKKTVAFEPFQYRYHPQIRQRAGLFRLSADGDGRGLSHQWTRFQRLQLDSLFASAGHAFGHWWEKYHKEHPDYFALQPGGTRSGFPSPGKVKICQANPAVWEQWLTNVAERLKTHPDEICFSASPNDSWNRGHCICEKCRAWDHPDGAPVRLSWEGLGQEYVSLSDRQITFANTLARLLKKRFLDRNLYVGMHAYGDAYTRAPLEAMPDDNVIISVVACFFLREKVRGRANRMSPDAHRQCFSDWAKVTPKLLWRPNTGNFAGWQQGQPDIALHQTIRDFRFVGENNCVGVYFDTVWENWPTQAPQYYLMAQMTWNPKADGEAILKDYYRRGFGPAAGKIEAYWQLLEETRNRKIEEDLDYPTAYDEALFTRAYALLDEANALLADAPEVYRERVAFFRAGLDFTRLMVDIRDLMAKFLADDSRDQEAADEVRANWERVRQIAEKNLMNYRFYRPGNRYSQGLHPDYLPDSKVKKQPRRVPRSPKPKRSAKLVPAEKAGWRLAFSDDFEQNELEDGWKCLEGEWTIEDGCVRGSGTLISTRGFSGAGSPGFQRMEFEVSTDVKPLAFLKKATDSSAPVSDLSSFIHAKLDGEEPNPLGTGYFFQFGGFWNTKNQLRRAGVTLQTDAKPGKLITPGKFHRIVVQNDEGLLSMFVDGTPVLEHQEVGSTIGDGHDRVGFYFYTAAKVRHVRVYVKAAAN